MRSAKKIFNILLVLILIIIPLTGCSESPKTFSAAGMSITLNEDFSIQELESATAFFYSLSSLVIVEKFEFEDLKSEGLSNESSLDDFSKYIIKDYGLSPLDEFTQEENKNYIYSEYTNKIQGSDYVFVPCLFKSGDAFWVINFCTPDIYFSDFKPDFFKWADSVTFDNPA